MAARVTTSGGDHPIWVGWGIIEEIGERIKSLFMPPVVYVISDDRVSEHARMVQIALETEAIPAHIFMIPSGESNKNLETVQHVYKWLADRKAERGQMIVAVGGGVVGDLAGFVAATYLRGMPFAQVPTTLLAMMDAAVGGKVAVDLPQGKNLVGAFYQPRFVLSDVKTLSTLPTRELSSGWAEAIKHGLILDKELLSTFEKNIEKLKSLDPEIATQIIRDSVAIKANIVSQDEKETLGIRILLNYGHTIGHAIESATKYTQYLHGEAVSVGMMAAASISRSMGLLGESEVKRQRSVLASFGLPINAYGLNSADILEAMRSDKKTSGGQINWVLLDGIGNAVTNNCVPDDYVTEALDSILADNGEADELGQDC
ncbi:uncharacterized protein METZ01_LOCUS117274 [marine metagenome]|uniref:3-dehydroquinate synthase n=1 Tax=marine metagenome TaxID=408172 RepID=A0A381XIK1_9ZZZZ